MVADTPVHAGEATAVIITARNAAATITRAAASALAQALVSEVVVVDDGSTDDTARAAASAEDGSGRLNVIRLMRSEGPSHGRNLAIANSTAPLICILDADDFMGHGRVECLVRQHGGGWDLIADDIQFASGADETLVFDRLLQPDMRVPCDLTLATFARGNLKRHARFRRELGFLKPIIRRSFLERNGLCYEERLRLGEDFVLFARCLLAGARFRVVDACGYYAVQTPGSLSGSHTTEAIGRLHDAVAALVRDVRPGAPPAELLAVERAVRRNHDLRRALDAKRAGGWRAMVAALPQTPSRAARVVAELAFAKLAPWAQRGAEGGRRE